ncbi:MAG: isochorismate synthase [Candidatus Dormibacteraeota bacterium]|nr:isochorismate synthase [Candidatus Dormibacteraeota bacterium]
MTVLPAVSVRELDHTPDLVTLAGAARDAGQEVMLIERPMPDAVSVLAVGRRLEIVSTTLGVALEDVGGRRLDEEAGIDRVAAAGRLWRRLAEMEGGTRPGLPATGVVAVGGFAFDPTRQPGAPWAGFPGLLFRVPELAVTRVRGRTFVSGDEALLALPEAYAAVRAHKLTVAPARPPGDWCAAVAEAARRLRSGAAAKVVLAREIVARADGVISAGAVAAALRAAYPACFTYLISGADGTAFTGASPELLVRRQGGIATSQPMAGSTARGDDEAGDEQLAELLRASAKDGAEHQVTAEFVADRLRPFSRLVERGRPEVLRLTNIQHLATTVLAQLMEPPAGVLELAAALHPTPAVGGFPPDAARVLIEELECLERGWYAGAVGWIDGRGDGELAVAIRCGLLWEDGARLYAGNGMMPDSDPEAELRETELKFRALLGAMTG